MSKKASLIKRIQDLLVEQQVQGWLFYDFRGGDDIAYRILQLDSNAHATRRWFYLIPAKGEPRKLVHRIESGKLDSLPGKKHVYLRWSELREGLKLLLTGINEVAMQYSPDNAIPYISRVDGGTIELIRRFGTSVVPSGDLIQHCESVWTDEQYRLHLKAAHKITGIVNEAFRWCAERVLSTGETDEYRVQQFIMKRFAEEGLETDFPAIVGANQNSGDPHYAPTRDKCSKIRRGDLLLIDLWARIAGTDSVYADITWTAFLGASPGERILQVFDIVRRARDIGVTLLERAFAEGREVQGWEVDRAVRDLIAGSGFADQFIHRTGHNLGRMVHGNGVNFDDLETHDTRTVIPGIGCTIEPGIYLEDFGIRSEINVYIGQEGPRVTTPSQTELLHLLD